MRKLTANTLLWLHERPHERGTEFKVVEKPDPAATKPVEVDPGTAALWQRRGKAIEVTAAAKKAAQD